MYSHGMIRHLETFVSVSVVYGQEKTWECCLHNRDRVGKHLVFDTDTERVMCNPDRECITFAPQTFKLQVATALKLHI